MRGYAVAALLGGALALGACSSLSSLNVFAGKEGSPADPNVFPAGYKQEMLRTFTHDLVDPSNIHDAAITDPVLRPAGLEQRYAVCMFSESCWMNAAKPFAVICSGVANSAPRLASRSAAGPPAFNPF